MININDQSILNQHTWGEEKALGGGGPWRGGGWAAWRGAARLEIGPPVRNDCDSRRNRSTIKSELISIVLSGTEGTKDTFSLL